MTLIFKGKSCQNGTLLIYWNTKHSLWFKAQKLSLNIKETCTLTFSNINSVRNRINNIYIDGTQIDTVYHTPFLGMIIDNKISWNGHIKYPCKQISKCVGLFLKVNIKERKKLLLTYITPLYIPCYYL